MSDSETNKKIDELLEILKQSPAMNGGFNKLSDSVESIKSTNTKVLYELQLVKTNQDVHTKKIGEMYKAMYDPDDGLYSRITTAIKDNQQQEEDIDSVRRKALAVELQQIELSKKVNENKIKHETLERIAGKDLQDLRETISTKKNMIRTLWIFGSAAIAGIVKFLWDVAPNISQLF